MKITRFEEFLERAVPWFLAFVLLTILLVLQGCKDEKHVCAVIISKRYMGSNGWGVNKIPLPAKICEFSYKDGDDFQKIFQDSCKLYSVGDNICKNHKPCE